MNESTFRKSSYNVVIPLSASTSESSYIIGNPLYGNASIVSAEELEILSGFPNVDNSAVISHLLEFLLETHMPF